MRVLVAIKRVLDYNARVRFKADMSNVDLAGSKMSMNPFCEIAVEEAVRLREAGKATEVLAVSIGDDSAQEVLRSALAMGVDRATLLHISAPTSSLAVARGLAAVCTRENPSLVLLGKQAIDSDLGTTGPILGGLLGWPQALAASRIDVDVSTSSATVTQEVEGGLETVRLPLPAVVTTDLRLNKPRFATLPAVMRAKKKPIERIPFSDIADIPDPQYELLSVSKPQPRPPGVVVDSVGALVEELKRRGFVEGVGGRGGS